MLSVDEINFCYQGMLNFITRHQFAIRSLLYHIYNMASIARLFYSKIVVI